MNPQQRCFENLKHLRTHHLLITANPSSNVSIDTPFRLTTFVNLEAQHRVSWAPIRERHTQPTSSIMCVESYQHFTKCDHVVTTLTACPTYQKEQESVKTFLAGNLFRRHSGCNKNCGTVIPHHIKSEAYCQACLMNEYHSKMQVVSQGAAKVRTEQPQELSREERKEAARASLRRSYDQKGQHRSHHTVLGVESSVWLSGPDHQPETLAKKEVCTREANATPQISSCDQTRGHSREIDTNPRASLQDRRSDDARGGSGRIPTHGNSRPTTRPVRPPPEHQYTNRYGIHFPPLPPAVGRPLRLRQDRPAVANGIRTSGYPELRHRPERIENPTRSVRAQPTRHRQSPINGMAPEVVVRTDPRPEASRAAYPDPAGRRLYREVQTTNRGAGKTALSGWIDRTKKKPMISGASSDESFVCIDSMALTEQASDRPRAQKTSRTRRR